MGLQPKGAGTETGVYLQDEANFTSLFQLLNKNVHVVVPPLPPKRGHGTTLERTSDRCADDLNEARWSTALLNRSNRFHTLFHLPKRFGSARQVML